MKDRYTINNFLKLISISDLNVSYEQLHEMLSTDDFKNYLSKRLGELTVGGAILVKNQEKLITRAISSSLNYCDKLVICDTGSTDHTLSKISKYLVNPAITLIEKEWVEDYSKMRNHVVSFLDTDWIFIIDSDEYMINQLDKTTLKTLLLALEFLSPEADIALCFKQLAEGIEGAGFPQRLYQNKKNIKFYGLVHEELRADRLLNIKTEIQVFNSGTSVEQSARFNKRKRYDNLLLKNIEKEPLYSKWYSLLSNEYIQSHTEWYMNQVTPIIKNIELSLPNRDFFSIKLYSIYILLLFELGNDLEIIYKKIDFATEHFFDNPIFYYYKYLFEIYRLQQEAKLLLNSLNNDFIKMKNNHSEWDVYFPIESIEAILYNLLLKSEEYSLLLNSIEELSSLEKEKLLNVFNLTNM